MSDGITFKSKQEDRAYLAEPPQPVLSGKPPKLRARSSQEFNGVRFFAPFFPEDPAEILGVSSVVNTEEATSIAEGSYTEVPVKPKLFKGPVASMITDGLDRFQHLHSKRFAYTTLVHWLLPKERRNKPKPEEIQWSAPLVHELVEELKPRIILAFGKPAFDELTGLRMSYDDVRYGWFSYRHDPSILVYLMDPVTLLLTQPWTLDNLYTDLQEVNRMLGQLKQVSRVGQIQREYLEIRTMAQLEELVNRWERENRQVFSVDCEWGGTQFIDGRLRSIQFCWEAGKVAYLNFFDENQTYILGRTQLPEAVGIEVEIHPNQSVCPGEFYIDYEAVGEVLGRWLNRPTIRYIGHHVTADSTWMERWLKLDVLGKFIFDLEFAQQCCDEYSKLGLEYMALKYTDFGRYDMDLVLWKRENKLGEDDGYGKIPDSILIPYACIDVDVVMRAWPQVRAELERQGLTHYYDNLVVPFVTDTFHTWITTGLHVDPMLFDLTRKFFNWAYQALQEDFRIQMAQFADQKLAEVSGLPPQAVAALSRLRDEGQVQAAMTRLRELAPEIPEPIISHWEIVRAFNIRSHPMMSRFLFDVLGLEPIKSTKNSENGMPSMLWEKVLELPEKLRKTIKPAVDKETLEILAEADESGMIDLLLSVNNVGNQCKGFLKEGEKDSDGEVVKENGLAKFITSDGRLVPNYSLTETGRPRGWKPNPLNLSKYHNKGVTAGMKRVLENKNNNPAFVVPDIFSALFGTPEQRENIPVKDLIKTALPSIRSTIKAPEGWCYVESDLTTAEIRGQAFIFGDPKLIEMMCGVDKSFGRVRIGQDVKPVRLFYPDDSGIDPANRDPGFILHYCPEDGEPVRFGFSDLLRNEDGSLQHPPYDLHWSIAEMAQGKPRETMSADRDRGSGKVANFCVLEGQPVLTDSGWKEIQDVLVTDKVWDGEEWVGHDGVVEQGVRPTILWNGIRVTGNHDVWGVFDDDTCKMLAEHAVALGVTPLCLLPPDCPPVPPAEGKSFGRVYDLLNAGPRNRFTCGGNIVSNSGAYGAVGTTLERRIYAVTGIKPEKGAGDRLLEALSRRQPIAVAGLEAVAEKPKTGESLRAASGRIRHFPIHPKDLKGIPWRIRNSYLRAMGNEARNFYLQESVAATLAKACKWLNDFFRRTGMRARTVIGLYDAMLTLCPEEERFVVVKAHQVFLTDINVWEYHDRWMNYPQDTEFCYRWSWKPTKDEKYRLQDPGYRPMNAERYDYLISELENVKERFFGFRPEILRKLNKV